MCTVTPSKAQSPTNSYERTLLEGEVVVLDRDGLRGGASAVRRVRTLTRVELNLPRWALRVGADEWTCAIGR